MARRKYIDIPGLAHNMTQEEVDIVKAYEPPKKKLYLYLVPGDWSVTASGYLVLQGNMLSSAISSILFNHKENS